MNKIKQFFHKNSVTIAVVVIFLSLAGMITLQAIALSSLSEQSKKQGELLRQIEKSAKQRTKQIQAVDDHIDCALRFFAQTERDGKTIDNPDQCLITETTEDTAPTNQPSQPSTKPVTQPTSQPAPEKKPGKSQAQEKSNSGVVETLKQLLRR